MTFPIKFIFMALFLWWAYLFFATAPVVVFDSEGYEQSGRMIQQQGWQEFFRTGPQREPMFPALMALSMQLGQWWGIPYYGPLKMIGILFLFLTLVFAYRLMRMLSVGRVAASLAVFYLGISPVMTNSSMRIWSEFAAYPWIVLAVIWTIKSWRLLDHVRDDRRGWTALAGHALMVALMFLSIMSVKAVAEGVLLFYLWPFYWAVFSDWRAGRCVKAKHAAVFCLVVLCAFEGVVNIYRLANLGANGHFTYTTRGDWALYGNTARRMQPLSPRRLGAALAFVPGTGICQAMYGSEDCDFWSARHSDDIVFQKRDELAAQGITGQAASGYFIGHSIQMILTNPLQQVLLMAIEAHKMFFWESSIAFVAYPDWLEAIFYSPGFMNAIKYIFAFFSWAGCVSGLCYLYSHRRRPSPGGDGLLWVLNFIFWYLAMYSLYFILDRYSFPIVSLFMVLAAFLWQKTVTMIFK